jgi:hypothetical protein
LNIAVSSPRGSRRLAGLFFASCSESKTTMFTIWFSEGGERLTEREWPTVPRVGESVTLHDSTGLYEVIRVHWQEHGEASKGLVANVSLRSVSS